MKKALVVGTGSVAKKHIKILSSLKYDVHVYSENNSLSVIVHENDINYVLNIKNIPIV